MVQEFTDVIATVALHRQMTKTSGEKGVVVAVDPLLVSCVTQVRLCCVWGPRYTFGSSHTREAGN